MYLSDNELKQALDDGSLIVHPLPDKIGPSSIDLHLGPVTSVSIWDVEKWQAEMAATGADPSVYLGGFDHKVFGTRYQCAPPRYDRKSPALVMLHDEEVVIRPGGFLLWMTREIVGTPEEDPQYICFVDGKSTRARTGIVVHLTAPTIHVGWQGNVVLEIANLGPLTFRLCPGDAIAQITVARVTSPPSLSHAAAGSVTYGQTDPTGI